MQAWKAEPRTGRGGQPRYSDLAIATALTLRTVFRLALRQTEGLIGLVLHVEGGSLIAAPLSRPSFTSPARVMVLFAVSAGCRNIWSGPEDRHCKVHNGLTLITRPSPRHAIACTLALGRCVLAYLTSFDELRCHGRRGPAERLAGSPDTVQDHRQLAR